MGSVDTLVSAAGRGDGYGNGGAFGTVLGGAGWAGAGDSGTFAGNSSGVLGSPTSAADAASGVGGSMDVPAASPPAPSSAAAAVAANAGLPPLPSHHHATSPAAAMGAGQRLSHPQQQQLYSVNDMSLHSNATGSASAAQRGHHQQLQQPSAAGAYFFASSPSYSAASASAAAAAGGGAGGLVPILNVPRGEGGGGVYSYADGSTVTGSTTEDVSRY